ncbi:hypothetical protein GCM10025872_33400 [Barrientosiimonas endolithica]|uniref:Lipoprotein n=2 Tax=Barrientosiimonas endolithica TaxID=1535208 RepID=A0ABN6YQY7_9MICO|nr:hypothetical protein GCM10025872_33400 [Barrientosiimonas endolithica]
MLMGSIAAAGLAGCTTDGGSTGASSARGSGAPSASSATATPTPRPTLPTGGRTIFPAHRLFGYSGSPASPALGRLGAGNDLNARVDEMLRQSTDFAAGRKILPVVELIATLVHPKPGADGMYRSRVERSVVDTYLAAARRAKGILLLNIQPGRAEFIDEVRYFESYLTQPDVGVALDPEWSVKEGQVPGRVFGSTTGAALDECARYLSGLVTKHDLPEKVMLYHQLHLSIVSQETDLKQHPGIALVKSIDGIGSPADKKKAYDMIVAQTPSYVRKGFKLFFEEDARSGPLMTAEQVLALSPQPEYVLYE